MHSSWKELRIRISCCSVSTFLRSGDSCISCWVQKHLEMCLTLSPPVKSQTLNHCTHIQVKVAVFQRQFFQFWLILFKHDVLDERGNNQHPMPQWPGRAKEVINNTLKHRKPFFLRLTRLTWWSPDVADRWGHRGFCISDQTPDPDTAAETPLCSQRTRTLAATSQSGVWSAQHRRRALKCPPPAKSQRHHAHGGFAVCFVSGSCATFTAWMLFSPFLGLPSLTPAERHQWPARAAAEICGRECPVWGQNVWQQPLSKLERGRWRHPWTPEAQTRSPTWPWWAPVDDTCKKSRLFGRKRVSPQSFTS